MKTGRRSGAWALAILISTALAWPAPAPASWNSPTRSPCAVADARYRFDETANTFRDAAQRELVREAFDRWNRMAGRPSPDGNPFSVVRILEAGPGETANVIVRPVPGLPSGSLAETSCDAGTGVAMIVLDTGLGDDQLDKTSMHEMGHYFGMRHTGRNDSFDVPSNRAPVMEVCIAGTPRLRARDDNAGMFFNWTPLPGGTLMDNPTFENTHDGDRLRGWTWAFGTPRIQNTNGIDGYYVNHVGASGTSFFEQRTNYTYRDTEAGTLEHRATVRAPASPPSGDFRVETFVRRVEYEALSGGCGAGQYANPNTRQNIRQDVFLEVRRLGTLMTAAEFDGGDWWYLSPNYTGETGQYTVPVNWHGVDVKTRFINELHNRDIPATAFVDNFRSFAVQEAS